MYKVIFSQKAEKQLDTLEYKIAERILSTLERIRIRPEHYVKRLVGCPYYSLRVGDYRVILDIQDDKLIIFVIELGHRKNIYK